MERDDNRIHIYVGNLPFQLSGRELRELFEKYGDVAFAKIVRDRETKKSKGFGFVEMTVETEAQKAIESLNQTNFKERVLTVDRARPRENRPSN